MRNDDEYGETIDAINTYHLRQREQRSGIRGRWAEIKTNLIRGWRGGKDTSADDDVYVIAAQRLERPLHLVDIRDVLDDDE